MASTILEENRNGGQKQCEMQNYEEESNSDVCL